MAMAPWRQDRRGHLQGRMLVKELEDLLVLVRELPREDQLKCARALWSHVEEWEERQQEPELSDTEWQELQAQHAETRRHPREELRVFEGMGCRSPEPRSGIVESFDRTKGYGYIRMEDDERALLHITCLRASGYQNGPVGANIEFMAVRRASEAGRPFVSFRFLRADRFCAMGSSPQRAETACGFRRAKRDRARSRRTARGAQRKHQKEKGAPTLIGEELPKCPLNAGRRFRTALGSASGSRVNAGARASPTTRRRQRCRGGRDGDRLHRRAGLQWPPGGLL